MRPLLQGAVTETADTFRSVVYKGVLHKRLQAYIGSRAIFQCGTFVALAWWKGVLLTGDTKQGNHTSSACMVRTPVKVNSLGNGKQRLVLYVTLLHGHGQDVCLPVVTTCMFS